MKGPGGRGEVEVAVSGVAGSEGSNLFFDVQGFSLFFYSSPCFKFIKNLVLNQMVPRKLSL